MDKLPKRRKSKDNPYTLKIVNNIYLVIFKDSCMKEQIVEISEEVFNQMSKFELEDISQMHKIDRHIEHSEVYEESLDKRAVEKPISFEDSIIKKMTFEELKGAVNMLSEVQKRRVIKYYFDDKNEYQIAREENATQQSVHISLERAKEKLKEFLKKYKF